MSDWEPVTEAEAAMRDALLANDQDLYFRILARTELLLPVSADTMAGRAPAGWGTWTSENRTHVLSFTSGPALTACLGSSAGSFRRVAFQELAADWPNQDWWLAVNPGLSIEAYLPSWFVAQLNRGDIQLPGRTMGARARMARSEMASVAQNRARGSVTAPVPQPRSAQASSDSLGLDDRLRLGRRGLPLPQPQPVETVEAEVVEVLSGSATPGALGTATAETPMVELPPVPAVEEEPTEWMRPTVPVSPPEPTPAPVSPAAAPPPPVSLTPPSPTAPSSSTDSYLSAADAWAAGFVPANRTESSLLAAAQANNTDEFLSTLLLARVIVPVPIGTPSTIKPSSIDFPWQLEEADGQIFLCVFTSPERLAEYTKTRLGADLSSMSLRFVQLIGAWPDPEIYFSVNPGSPVGATLPGTQIVALAGWAAEVGLRDEPSGEVMVATPASAPSSSITGSTKGTEHLTVMQKTISPAQLPYYLERGYDRVSGFVHRASEVERLGTPAKLFHALGLGYPDSPFHEDDEEVYVLRWVAHRADLYRIPYGGQHEAGMRAMQGWVIERPPFRGNGFAPGDSSDVVAEFKVDSVRLPHEAELWRLDRFGGESLIATFNADKAKWLRTESRPTQERGPYA